MILEFISSVKTILSCRVGLRGDIKGSLPNCALNSVSPRLSANWKNAGGNNILIIKNKLAVTASITISQPFLPKLLVSFSTPPMIQILRLKLSRAKIGSHKYIPRLVSVPGQTFIQAIIRGIKITKKGQEPKSKTLKDKRRVIWIDFIGKVSQ